MTCEERQAAFLLGDADGWTSHAASCVACSEAARGLGTIRDGLDAPVAPPSAALDAAVTDAVAPLLRRRAVIRHDLPRFVTALGVALLPLPVLLPLGYLGLGRLHGLLAQVFPPAISTALVASQALLVALVMALTYASVPLLTERQRRALLEAA